MSIPKSEALLENMCQHNQIKAAKVTGNPYFVRKRDNCCRFFFYTITVDFTRHNQDMIEVETFGFNSQKFNKKFSINCL